MSDVIYMGWLPILADFVLSLGDRLDYDFIETDGRYNTFRIWPKREGLLEPFTGQYMPKIDNPVEIILHPWGTIKFPIWVGWSDKEQTVVWCEENKNMIFVW